MRNQNNAVYKPVADDMKGMIFDCDGTLVDSMPLHMDAWRHTFRHFRIDMDENFLFSLRGMKEVDIVKSYNLTYGTNLEPEVTVRKKHDYFEQHIASVKPIPEVAAIAKEHFGKIPLAVVSGSMRKIVHRELQVTGLFALFEVILTAEDPFKPKPAPDAFLEAARRMHVEPRFCQVFEDGDAGLEAARNAGMVATDVRML